LNSSSRDYRDNHKLITTIMLIDQNLHIMVDHLSLETLTVILWATLLKMLVIHSI